MRTGQAKRLLACFVAVALLVALDLWSKSAVFDWLENPNTQLEIDGCRFGHQRVVIVDDWLAFMLSLNPGMAWGLRLPPHILVFGRIAAVLFLIVLLVRAGGGRKLLTSALVLILAGAIGNLHDNLFMSAEGLPFGKVRDFIDVYFPGRPWHFPTFNVADSCITVGAVLLILGSFSKEPEPEPEPKAAKAPKAPRAPGRQLTGDDVPVG
jgi:signal peptidase II